MFSFGKPTQKQIDRAAGIIYEQTKDKDWHSWRGAKDKSDLGHPGAEYHVSRCIGMAIMILGATQ